MPDILIQDVQSDYLTGDAREHSELELLIERAERKVLGRYREVDAGQDLVLGAHYDAGIRLDGYVEADDGTPDLKKMDQNLLDALRATVASIVEFWASKPSEAEHVESQSQGDRSVSFRDKGLSSSVYAPLRSYDERRAWH